MLRSSSYHAGLVRGKILLRQGGFAGQGDVRVPTIDDLRKRGIDKECPECAKHRKHVKLVETDGKVLECPECHFMHTHLSRR